MHETANLSVIEGEADELLVSEGRVTGIRLADGRELTARAVVITTGTFLARADPSWREELAGRPGR